jgi:hypothetical protein
MTIVNVLAVYRVSPLLLVAETDDGTVLECSLPELKAGGYRFSDQARKELLDGYQVFTCR